MNFKKLCTQIFRFLIISGTGWLIDFLIYCILILKMNFIVGYANFISAIPALTFVFIFSTKKVFENQLNGITLKKKYYIYFVYQMILISCVSWLGQYLYKVTSTSWLCEIIFIKTYLKLLIKLVITPITMLLNFCVMKFLCEKY
ncbi:GtrA family protein [Clostridium sp. ZBS12]|uniref:GtrA family protein n=1 Tax=Clostridium sp. ZBS12 TaxID=2949972 RepID=UPI00207AB192|nr:GtrA family protein [Clostridium sp. ZBS12]